MAKRKSLSQKVRFEVFRRDKFTCQYCGRQSPDIVLEVDHIEPVSKGGTNDLFNLITSCYDCNHGKSDKKLDSDYELIKQKKELDLKEERRKQRKMLLEWKKSLIEDTNEIIDDWCDYFSTATGFSIIKDGNSFYNIQLPKLIKKYGFNLMIESIDAGVTSYIHQGTQKEAEKIIDKLGGIAYNLKMEKENKYFKDANDLLWCLIKKYKSKYRNFYLKKRQRENMISTNTRLLEFGVKKELLRYIISKEVNIYILVFNYMITKSVEYLKQLRDHLIESNENYHELFPNSYPLLIEIIENIYWENKNEKTD